MEIEKKFTIKSLPDDIEGYEKKEIRQGYLCDKPTVRIRRQNDEYILTYKELAGNDIEGSTTICCEETEIAISKEAFIKLEEKVSDNIIIKTRYIIPLENNLKAELDVFHGNLEGLCFAEVEFPDVQSSEDFVKPEWFDKDVSDDYHYKNTYLSGLTSYRGTWETH